MKILIEDFNTLENHYRANLINSVIGVKQASLIGTVGVNCISNLALFSSTVHLGSNPPLVAIFSRPEGDTPKQTLKNIRASNPKIKKGICLRYIEEIFLNGINRTKMSKNFGKGEIKNWF